MNLNSQERKVDKAKSSSIGYGVMTVEASSGLSKHIAIHTI